jgi:hypothetical protein
VSRTTKVASANERVKEIEVRSTVSSEAFFRVKLKNGIFYFLGVFECDENSFRCTWSEVLVLGVRGSKKNWKMPVFCVLWAKKKMWFCASRVILFIKLLALKGA